VPYFTALRHYTAKRIEEIDDADILIGIPCYNNEKTIAHVVQMVTHGLDTYYRNLRNVIFVADDITDNRTFDLDTSDGITSSGSPRGNSRRRRRSLW